MFRSEPRRGWRSALSRLQKRCPDGRRDFNGDEAIRSEEVVLAAFVDDPQVALSLGLIVSQDCVDLVALE